MLPTRIAEGLGSVLISCVPLIIVDNIHFQYNSFLTSFLLISIAYLFKRNFVAVSQLFVLYRSMRNLLSVFAHCLSCGFYTIKKNFFQKKIILFIGVFLVLCTAKSETYLSLLCTSICYNIFGGLHESLEA